MSRAMIVVVCVTLAGLMVGAVVQVVPFWTLPSAGSMSGNTVWQFGGAAPSTSAPNKVFETTESVAQVKPKAHQSAIRAVPHEGSRFDGFVAEEPNVYGPVRVEKPGLWWDAVFPGREFEPYEHLYLIQKFRKHGSVPSVWIETGFSIYSGRDAAYFNAASATFGMDALPPKTTMRKKAPSGLPLGESVWMGRVRSNDQSAPPPYRIIAHDGVVSSGARVIANAEDPRAKSVRFPRITKEEIAIAEHILRIMMSAGMRVVADFDTTEVTTIRVRGISVRSKQLPEGVRVVNVSDVVRGLGWEASEENGVWSVRASRNSVVLPLAGRVAIVDGKEVELRFPIVQNDQGVWADIRAFQ